MRTRCPRWRLAVRRWKPSSRCSMPRIIRTPAGRCFPASRHWGCSWPWLGSRVMLAAVQNGYDFATKDPEGLQGALRVKDKDLIRGGWPAASTRRTRGFCLAAPSSGTRRLVEQSFGERGQRAPRPQDGIHLAGCVGAQRLGVPAVRRRAQRHGCGHSRHALHGRPPLVHLGGRALPPCGSRRPLPPPVL